MQPTQWSSSQIKQCKQQTGEAMLSDEHSLFLFGEDFGKIQSNKPIAVCQPSTIQSLQSILHYANQHHLPVVIRGKGLSQSGQALPCEGGITIHLEQFDQVETVKDDSIWVQAYATWSDLLAVTVPQNLAPYIVPYNTQLTVGGVISAGGVGAASFQYGSVVRHVAALEVVTADGQCQVVDEHSPLFHACLAGQGQFGVITRACIKLRPCRQQVKTFSLVYSDQAQWLKDLNLATTVADAIESFCTPAIIGAKVTEKGRVPVAKWLYALHLTIEHDGKAPKLPAIFNPSQIAFSQEESIDAYFHRHDSRFAAMKMLGQWDLHHPWYECFIPQTVLAQSLDVVLASLPLYYANVLQITPLSKTASAGFMKLPDAESVFGVMILTPGVIGALLPSCLSTIEALDKRFLSQGGKRYLSGYLGEEISKAYWQRHYGTDYERWVSLKQQYDPNRVFRSTLYG